MMTLACVAATRTSAVAEAHASARLRREHLQSSKAATPPLCSSPPLCPEGRQAPRRRAPGPGSSRRPQGASCTTLRSISTPCSAAATQVRRVRGDGVRRRGSRERRDRRRLPARPSRPVAEQSRAARRAGGSAHYHRSLLRSAGRPAHRGCAPQCNSKAHLANSLQWQARCRAGSRKTAPAPLLAASSLAVRGRALPLALAEVDFILTTYVAFADGIHHSESAFAGVAAAGVAVRLSAFGPRRCAADCCRRA